MDADFYTNATRWLSSGLSLIPIATDGSKSPAVHLLPKSDGKRGWKRYTETPADQDELDTWLQADVGIGIIGGAVSGNLVIFDFDEPHLAQNWLQVCGKDRDLADIAFEMPQVSTPNGGMHVYVRCTQPVDGSRKLAYTADHKTRIETKAEAGYVLAPGCPKKCHPTKRTYCLMRGSLGAIPEVTPDQLEALYRVSRVFNDAPPIADLVREPSYKPATDGHKRPGDAYNDTADLVPLLESHGWRRCGAHGDKCLWKRPGKDERGISATSNYANLGFFYVFSSNALPFEAGKAYSKFAVYTILEHGGDYSRSASALNARGFGDPPPKLKIGNRTADLHLADDPDPIAVYHRTDLGNSERFVRDHQANACYCHEIGHWFVWDGTRWRMDNTGAASRLAGVTARNIYNEAASLDDADERAAMSKWAIASEAASRLASMVSLASSDAAIAVTPDQLDAHPWLMCATNGIINLATGELVDADPGAYCTRQISCAYDPTAEAPTWLAFLRQMLPDDDVRQFVQRAVGYAMTGDVSEQCLFFLFGTGRNGKSTFLETISTLLGDYWVKTRADTIMLRRSDGGIPNDVAALRGARLVTVSEVNDGQRLNEALIKDLTGGDTISARFMRGEFFSFAPSFKLWLHGNHKPQIRGTDEGIWRRLRLVPFEVRLTEAQQDKTLPRRLRTEMPGILTWCVQGCLQWQQHGLSAPKAVLAATDAYRGEMDALGAFLADCCTLDPDQRATKSDMWQTYRDWCDGTGEKLFDTAIGFNRALAAHDGITDDRVRGIRRWRGIGIGKTLFSSDQPQTDQIDNSAEKLAPLNDDLGSRGANFSQNQPISQLTTFKI